MAKLLMANLLALVFLACAPTQPRPPLDDGNDQGSDMSVSRASPDLSPPPPDMSYACGQYGRYRARLSGVVRSLCDFDVSRVLSIGGDVKIRITPPAITLEFPDGTSFSGTTDGQNFTAIRTQRFVYTDRCNWEALETLRGTIAVGAGCHLSASYSYRETPLSPPPCAQACTVDAEVIIERMAIIIG